jgi:YVTN family beta-propeller protein
MKTFAALKALALVLLVASELAFAQNAYITNSGDNTVSVIDTATNTVVAVLSVGGNAFGVFIQPRFAGARPGLDAVAATRHAGIAQR